MCNKGQFVLEHIACQRVNQKIIWEFRFPDLDQDTLNLWSDYLIALLEETPCSAVQNFLLDISAIPFSERLPRQLYPVYELFSEIKVNNAVLLPKNIHASYIMLSHEREAQVFLGWEFNHFYFRQDALNWLSTSA